MTILVFMIVLLSGCSIKTTITDPDGRMYVVNSRRNAVVEFEKKDTRIKVNNRWFHVKVGKETE